MNVSRRSRGVFCVCLISSLAGCGDGGIQEVKQWMDEVRSQTKISVPKLSEPKKFTPFSYGAKDNLDPYNSSKLAIALAKINGKSGSALAPNPDRRKELLESYPLDTLKMVGTLQKIGLDYGLVLADRTVYQVKVGNYMGQNFGMITSVSESGIELKEIIQDAAGEWVERKAKLELQETKK
jgi:type IV pilus assembly protein PilP